MKKSNSYSILAVCGVVTMVFLFAGCGKNTGNGKDGNEISGSAVSDVSCSNTAEEEDQAQETKEKESQEEHEPITICAPGRNIKDFIDVVHKTYPEIVFDVDAYSGQNGTDYMLDQLLADQQADIYSISYYAASQYDLSDKLMDLAGYSFTDNYVSSRLQEVNENGWELPQSLQELEELAPKVQAAGYCLALTEIGLPGYRNAEQRNGQDGGRNSSG